MNSIDLNRIYYACRLTVLRFRSEQKLTQETLAERSGLTRQYISILETEGRNPQCDILYKLDCGFELPFGAIAAEIAKQYVQMTPRYAAVAEKNSVVWKTGKKTKKKRT